MTMYMISDSSVFLQYECIHILLAYMYTLSCSICMLSLFLLLSDNSWDQLMLFVLLYPTQNKSYVMLCYVMLCYVMFRYVSDRMDMHFDIHGYDTMEAGSMNVYLPAVHKEMYRNIFFYIRVVNFGMNCQIL